VCAHAFVYICMHACVTYFRCHKIVCVYMCVRVCVCVCMCAFVYKAHLGGSKLLTRIVHQISRPHLQGVEYFEKPLQECIEYNIITSAVFVFLATSNDLLRTYTITQTPTYIHFIKLQTHFKIITCQ